MRKPKYLSPTAVSKFYKDIEQYYLDYICETRTPRFPQTQPMAVGSAFDAYAKSFLHRRLFGNYGENNEFALDTIFEQQVEPHNRDWARKAGEYCFTVYKESGALGDLLTELLAASESPKFEFTVENRVAHESVIDGIPVLGKPDVYWTGKDGMLAIHDWKVNGFCAKYKKSPNKGYVKEYPSGKSHRNSVVQMVDGVLQNVSMTMTEANADWAQQLIAYNWVLCDDCPFYASIEQLCCSPGLTLAEPHIRVALLRFKITDDEIKAVRDRFATCWNAVQRGHIFLSLSLEDSMAKCKELDERAALINSDNPDDKAFMDMINMGRR